MSLGAFYRTKVGVYTGIPLKGLRNVLKAF